MGFIKNLLKFDPRVHYFWQIVMIAKMLKVICTQLSYPCAYVCLHFLRLVTNDDWCHECGYELPVIFFNLAKVLQRLGGECYEYIFAKLAIMTTQQHLMHKIIILRCFPSQSPIFFPTKQRSENKSVQGPWPTANMAEWAPRLALDWRNVGSNPAAVLISDRKKNHTRNW
jgi:hypothetical protein